MRKTHEAELQVQLQSPSGQWHDVGRLHHLEGKSWFESDRSYWQLPDRPVLGQAFEDGGPEWTPGATTALPTWFSHLLPEGLLRRMIADAANVKEQREFFLLRYIGGDDLPGATRVKEVEPSASGGGPTVASDVPDDSVPAELQLKFSLAGLQLKFSLVDDDEKGLTFPAAGQAGTWIAKLPDRRVGYEGVPEAEYATMRLAHASGIISAEVKLVDVASIHGVPEWAASDNDVGLLVRRFDRRPQGRQHMEELAQVLEISTGNPEFKYTRANFETVLRTVVAMAGEAAAPEVISRIVLNVLIGNGDAHLKNWAFVYPDGRQPVLSPAYDVVPTVLFLPDDNLGMKLAGSRRWQDVDAAAFRSLSKKAGITSVDVVDEARTAVERIVGNWSVLEESLDRDRFKRLTAHRDRQPLLWI